MPCLKEYILFVLGVLHLLLMNDQVLVDSLHSVKLAVVLVRHKKHLAKRAFVDDLNDFEIFEVRSPSRAVKLLA